MKKTNPRVDAFIKSEKQWNEETKMLREISLECGLNEDWKWSFPCYTSNGKNIAITQTFKNFCAFMFFQGHALKDPKKLLKAPGENSQTARRLEFQSPSDVKKATAAIKSFIKDALKVETSSTKAEKKPAKPAIPAEFKTALTKNSKLQIAFNKLTPGRQRLYLMHFSSAKQSATRTSRIEKCIPKILKGLGLNE